MKAKTILICLVAAMALSACMSTPPVFQECGGNNCRHDKEIEPT